MDMTIPRYSFSDLEKFINQLTQLQKENLNLLFELEETKMKLVQAKNALELESKTYSGIKKLFR